MEKKSFENYRVEDFVADESFTSYHFHSNEKDVIFWEEWLTENPLKRQLAEEAREIIQSLSLTPGEKEYQEEFEKIKAAINEKKLRPISRLLNWNKSARPDHRKRRLLPYIIILLILVTGATYLFVQRSGHTQSELNQMVNNGNKPLTFTLSDSTVVTLERNSTLKYPLSFQGKNRQVYLQGEAGFNVKRNETFPFKVHTKNIVTTVLGTIFNITTPGDSAVVVALLKGKLKVEIEDSIITSRHPILLLPDEKATYVFHDKHFYKQENARAFSVSFRQDNFKEIATRIKDISGKTVINRSDKRDWRFTGDFKNTTAKEIIENICLIKNLTSEVSGDTIFINN